MWVGVILGVLVLPIILIFKHKWIKNVCNKVKRDFIAIRATLKIVLEMRKVLKENRPVYKRFEEIVKRHPNKTAFLFEDEMWTFAEIEQLSNKIAIYFESEGFKKGDCVGILLHNCPEYISLWIGLSKIGVVSSLLNTNLGTDSIMHSIKIVNCKAIIFGSYFEELITTSIMPEFPIKGYRFNRYNESDRVTSNCINLSRELSSIDPAQPLKNIYHIQGSDPLLYIYTSGTTGLPKAAIVIQFRYSLFRCITNIIFKDAKKAIIYCPMPLYHGSGVAVGVGQMVMSGATIALRKKFSASNYWKDCKKYNCNTAQYIGEMLRYVLIASANEKVEHSVDLIFGNGLKSHVWKEFVKKFKVKRVVEFYAATEGTFALYNVDNTIGNTGYVPPYFRKFLPFKLIRFSEETEQPIRDSNGFCIECKENEPGLAIGRVPGKTKSISSVLEFSGYTDKKESSKKILQDVFEKGDRFFNSGDLLSFDKDGYFYFIDRIGDTYRWKGENVSTAEIEMIISKIIGLNDAVVYGVQVPGTEGKAGMVSLVDPDNTIDVNFLLEKFKQNIASYAIPIFIRVIGSVPITSTFKLQKYNLRSEGFNINVINDPLYFYDVSVQKYVPLTEEIYNNILNSKARL